MGGDRMKSVFNTTFENSLRILLLLSVDAKNSKTADMLSAVDFITVYGACLGISDRNLHGENPFNFSELTSRRGLFSSALKQLVIKGCISVEKTKSGFCYKINASGQSVVSNLDSDYADDYLTAARIALAFANEKTEQQLFAFINTRAALALKKGGSNA